ncbi:hypothetical protein [Rhodocista pekingensis]|uniref:Uncharacterized protein n=1 Tax=Rhodocista pekingensis TaxID=201185 RepID=A0ABW2KY57_9PROT
MSDVLLRALRLVDGALAAGDTETATGVARSLSEAGARDSMKPGVLAELMLANGLYREAEPMLRALTESEDDPAPPLLLGHLHGLLGLDAEAARFHALGTARAGDQVRRQIAALAATDGPILVGPWIGDVSHEILYWIPFLRRMADDFGLPAGRCIAVCRGGSGGWYADLFDRTLDLADVYPDDRLGPMLSERVDVAGYLNQYTMADVDGVILQDCADHLGFMQCHVLHPAIMFQVLRHYWTGTAPLDHALALLAPYPAGWPAAGGGCAPLADLATRFDIGDSFAPSDFNANFTASIAFGVDGLTLVDLATLVPGGDQSLPLPADAPLVQPVLDGVPPAPLAVQTAALAQARAFAGSLGPYCYLALAMGKPAFAAIDAYPVSQAPHVRLAARLAGGPGARLSIIHGEDWDRWSQALSAIRAA